MHPTTVPRTDPLTLRFRDPELEQAFMTEYIEKSLKTSRYALVIGVVVYGGLFGLMDWLMQTNALFEIWTIRAVVCVLALIVFAISRTSFYTRRMQELIGVVVVVAGIGLLLMIPLDNTPNAYVDGPVFFLLPIYVIFRLRFVYAVLIGAFLVVGYIAIVYLAEGMRGGELWAHAMFVFASNLIGMVAGYALENYARKEFWQTRLIDRERQRNATLLDAKNRFFANISHEIRTPLTLILGPLEDLLNRSEAPSDSTLRRTLASMRKNGYRLLKFMDQLLELARLDVERGAVVFKKQSLAAFLAGEVASFQPYADAAGLTLDLDPPAPDVDLVTDYDKLEIVLSNLVSNALKYTQRGGAVKVSARVLDDGRNVALVVKDNGPGIPAGAVDRIFDRFYRVHTDEQRDVPGLGLGLSLTRSLVLQMNGEIAVESEAGFGSTFTVRLTLEPDAEWTEDAGEATPVPAAAIGPAPMAAEDAVEDTPGVDGAGDRTILVIDDHPEVRRYLKTILQSEDYRVIEAGDGAKGLALLREKGVDLVLVDLMMPGMDGRTFTTEVRRDAALSHIPVVMLTASVQHEDRLSVLRAGADDYLTKPFHREEVLARIENLIMRQERLREKYAALLAFEPGEEDVVSAEVQFLARIRDVINEHLGNEHFNVDRLADEAGVSVRHLQRKLKTLANETPASLIRSMRLRKGRQLLEGGFGSVAETAYAVGFSHPAYFTKCFRETYGKTPTEWLDEREKEERLEAARDG